MFHGPGPTFFELARQVLSSTEKGYDLLAPKFDLTSFRTPDRLIESALARISHNGIISRAASAETAFTSIIRGDQHYCHGDRQAIGRRWQRFGFARANARFAGVAIPSLPIQITRR